jgi:hypothetical protein
MMTLRPRLVQRSHKFTGRHADRNTYFYGLFRLGASINNLARTSGLSSGRITQIIAAGNGGSSRARYLDELRAATE